MAYDENEVLPSQLLVGLKNEVEALQKKLAQPDAKANELILEMESLKDSIHDLTNLFQKALEETKEEDLSKVIKTVNERLDTVVSQNETIARGMIAISDKVEDWINKQRGSSPMTSAPAMGQGQSAPVYHSMGMPQMGSRNAPRPMGGAPDLGDLPPPPPQMNKKRTLGFS